MPQASTVLTQHHMEIARRYSPSSDMLQEGSGSLESNFMTLAEHWISIQILREDKSIMLSAFEV